MWRSKRYNFALVTKKNPGHKMVMYDCHSKLAYIYSLCSFKPANTLIMEAQREMYEL